MDQSETWWIKTRGREDFLMELNQNHPLLNWRSSALYKAGMKEKRNTVLFCVEQKKKLIKAAILC